jgi:ribosomal protein S18 acetylase RimI-like enzyme
MSNASIGQIGKPYYDKANNRVKWFNTNIQRNIQEVLSTLNQGISFLQNSPADRLAIRFITNEISFEELSRISISCFDNQIEMESYIPIDNKRAMVDFGTVIGIRKPSNSTENSEKFLLQSVIERGKKIRNISNNYSIESHGPQSQWSQKDAERLIQIYERTFSGYLIEFTVDSIMEMLQSNAVAVVRDSKEKIVSVAMAEIARIDLSDGSRISISEISEVATDPEHRGNGFATNLYISLITWLEAQKEVPIIFTEARANHAAIMSAAYKAGMKPCGKKPAHCIISSPFTEVKQPNPYGSLVIMAL